MYRHRLLEERSTKLCTALEDVYRLMAQQDMRRKRDRLAADCVRLGKIYTVRTSEYGECMSYCNLLRTSLE